VCRRLLVANALGVACCRSWRLLWSPRFGLVFDMVHQIPTNLPGTRLQLCDLRGDIYTIVLCNLADLHRGAVMSASRIWFTHKQLVETLRRPGLLTLAEPNSWPIPP
jgi:hypothetical protein